MKALNISETNPGILLYSNKKAYSDSQKKVDETTQNEIHKRTRGFKGIIIGCIVGISCWTLAISSVVSILN